MTSRLRSHVHANASNDDHVDAGDDWAGNSTVRGDTVSVGGRAGGRLAGGKRGAPLRAAHAKSTSFHFFSSANHATLDGFIA